MIVVNSAPGQMNVEFGSTAGSDVYLPTLQPDSALELFSTSPPQSAALKVISGAFNFSSVSGGATITVSFSTENE